MVILDYVNSRIELRWQELKSRAPVATMRVTCAGINELRWELEYGGKTEVFETSQHRSSIRARLRRLRAMFPVDNANFQAGAAYPEKIDPKTKQAPVEPLRAPFIFGPWGWMEMQIAGMARELGAQYAQPLFEPEPDLPPVLPISHDPAFTAYLERERQRQQKLREAEEARQERIEEARKRMREAQHRREQARRQRQLAAEKERAHQAELAAVAAIPPRAPVPPVPMRLELPLAGCREVQAPLRDLRGYLLRERAALWWVSNQSDDLLSLPYCQIERLEYQLRTALRVIGPLRGRALLSDEVGLGKTIEAGLVMKEYLTRGMIKRFLVLTVPSLVDQWEEELAGKFNLPTVTTNQPAFRADPAAFWREHSAIVASLHTLKQPAHLEIARQVNWDLLVIDEAHYLRNRTSQAWQAVNAPPRQFLLLLTATPVQNSLEELYNLVTLLQPGQLPSPKEFRDRFIDKRHPHQPREPEELRRLLGQVMIRNTRANAGIQLPPRRAETVLFDPEPEESAFREQWETDLRARLAKLNPGQASLWGRLLLQTAGSSPAAWRDALKSFPDRKAAREWSDHAPLEASWARKCDLLSPLTKGEGGVVIFTQYLHTQSAVAERLRAAGSPVWVINGQTPPPERQPITETFHREGGALLLTHSGTEGRNLQFCHRMVNFDLPWNPMEIEQRIGRLHRIGQRHPVRIFNFVARQSLQEHLLQILQEKLNLFELVVGETGLILGDRFSSDEFAEEILRRWRESDGRVAEALQSLGDELATARNEYAKVKQLDETLFAKDYESL